MIVYKNVVKKDDKYYSLMNYGFCCLDEKIIIKQPPYEIGKEYINNDNQTNRLKWLFSFYWGYVPEFIKTGFYVMKKNIPLNRNQLKWLKKFGADTIVCLKCTIKIEDIISHEKMEGIKMKKFKVLEEV